MRNSLCLFCFVFLFSSKLVLANCVPDFFSVISKERSVPSDVFYALALSESATLMNDGKVRPWPYSLNYLGETEVFPNYKTYVLALRDKLYRGETAVDVGYYQVNWRWHKQRVSSIGHLAHPVVNARVAADILKEQYAVHADWSKAAGRYHNPSNIDGRADDYAKGFDKWLRKIRNGYFC